MLVEFSVENFRSIKTLQTLSMQATSQKESDYHALNSKRMHSPKKNLNLVKTKAIFGANASGKSNVILAMVSFWKIIVFGLGGNDILERWIQPYRLDEKLEFLPSYFQIIIEIDGSQYRYGFEADSKRIKSEWLFKKEKKETEYFVREGQEIKSYNKNSFSEIKILNQTNNKFFREDTLILSVLYALNGEVSTIILDSIKKGIMIHGGDEVSEQKVWKRDSIKSFKENESYRAFIKNLLRVVDNSIHDIEIKKDLVIEPDGTQKLLDTNNLFVVRSFEDSTVFFDLEKEEGKGTQKVFALSNSLFDAIHFGKTFIIDEFDSRLHPDLTREIVKLFQSKEAHKNAQLIFVTHDSNLLDSSLLRRDQITFVEKNKSGETEIYDLSDIKGVRDTDLFEKNYLKGKYGALPILNNFKNKVLHG